MKNKILFICLIIIGLVSCSENKEPRNYNIEDFNNYEVHFTNNDYELNINSQIFTSKYFKMKDSILLSPDEKNRIALLFFENYIDTIKTDISVEYEDGVFISPDLAVNTVIITNKKNNHRVALSIDGNADSLNVNSIGQNILRFKEKTYEILRNNEDYQNAIQEMYSKKDDRIFY